MTSLATTHSRDTTRIAYRSVGEGPVLLLSAPTLCTHLHWSGVEARLARFCRTTSWDYRGHGESEALDDPARYTLERVVEDLAAVHAAVAEGEPAYLCGHSLGGLVSMSYALAHPERVRGLVLVNTGPGFRNPKSRQAWLELWERAAERLRSRGIASYLEHPRAILEILGQNPDSAAALRAREGVLKSSSECLAHFAAGVAAPQPDLSGSLGEIRAPALVLVGEDDRAFQAAGEVLEAGLAKARRTIVPGAGHALPLDQPEAFARELEGFLGAQ